MVHWYLHPESAPSQLLRTWGSIEFRQVTAELANYPATGHHVAGHSREGGFRALWFVPGIVPVPVVVFCLAVID